MEELRSELQRQRERTHELASDVMALKLELAELKGDVRQLNHAAEKYIPIVERLDDEDIERKAEARAAGKEAAEAVRRDATRMAWLVAGISVIGIVSNVGASFLH